MVFISPPICHFDARHIRRSTYGERDFPVTASWELSAREHYIRIFMLTHLSNRFLQYQRVLTDFQILKLLFFSGDGSKIYRTDFTMTTLNFWNEEIV